MSKPQNPAAKPYPARVGALLRRGHVGEVSSLPQLKRALEQYPDVARRFGDLPMIALEKLLSAVSGNSVTKREAIRQEIARLRLELAGPDAPLPVRLIAEQVIIAWVAVHHADIRLALALEARSAKRQIRAAERQAKAAQDRYFASIEALVTVRRLSQPITSVIEYPTVSNEGVRQHRAGSASSRGEVAAVSA